MGWSSFESVAAVQACPVCGRRPLVAMGELSERPRGGRESKQVSGTVEVAAAVAVVVVVGKKVCG